MVRKIFLIFLIILCLITFFGNVYAVSLGYGSIADYYPLIMTFQGTSSINNVTFPSNYPTDSINWSRSIITGNGDGGSVLIFTTDTSSNYTGYWSYFESNGHIGVANYTNLTYQMAFRGGGNDWVYFRTSSPNDVFSFDESYWTDPNVPFPFIGSEVLVRYNNQGAYVFSNYVSSTLNISSSRVDLENAGIDYPVIFSNAQLNIGLTNLNAYVSVSYQASNDNSNWTDMSYVVLTNNTELYNSQTHSFYITLQNLIDRDLAIGDKIKIEYSWATLDRLGNPHVYSFYEIYTRSTAYVDGEAYEPAPEPGSGGGSDGGSDGSAEINNSLIEQTQAINEQTNAIEKTTQSVDNLNDNLMNQNTTDPSSIDIQDNTQNNTADLSNFFNTIQNAFNSRDSSDKTFTLKLPNGDDYTFTFPKSFIRSVITGNTALNTFLSAFWYIVFGGFIIFDMKKMYNKFKNGDFEGAMNSSSVDNVVKEALR